jgi:HEAT repeat protein
MRALALLVDRMAMAGAGRAVQDMSADHQARLRDALRQLTGRIREGALLCRVMDGQFVLAGVPVDRGLTRDDPLLGDLLQRCLALGVGGITVRQGASPGELLTLASLLSQSARTPLAPMNTDTPTTIASVGDSAHRELLRSWSVLVTPVDTPREQSAPEHEAQDGHGASAASALARLAAAHSDRAANAAADLVIDLIADAEMRGDARQVEGIARSCMAHLHQVGTGGGRLAMERLLRRLQARPAIDLLAQRLPHAIDRLPLLELLARGGETAVDILVDLLMEAEDSPARRAYFDSIVTLDLGSRRLFELVRDNRWFVARNAVALLGEMGVQLADVTMLPLLSHDDDRIRIAVARALMRLGTPKATQGLHVAIDDRHAEVRRIAAAAYGQTSTGPGSVRPPAARLAAALERETDEDVALEMLASLGKLGSADAIQRLLRIAQPSVSESGEKVYREAWLRIAALEALVKARGNAVMPALEALANDPDPDVAAAVARLRG